MKEKIKILIADDNLDFVSNLVTYFQSQSDMEVIATAKDGIEAYEKILKEKPTVALIDVIMPHVDGLGVLEKLCSTNETLPICIMLSAVGQDSVTAKAIGSATVQSFFKGSLIGIGVPNLHLVHIRQALIPIPPLAEQIRLSNETNRIFEVLSKIEKSLS